MTAETTVRTEAGKTEITVSKVFDAPRQLVWEAWTRPEHFSQWFGPHNSSMPFCEFDVRPGGTLHFLHRLEGFPDVWIGGVFDEVVEPERLAFTFHFTDEHGNRTERPGFPMQSSIDITFQERDGRTTVTLHHTGLEVDQGESQGTIESFERLEAYLPSMAQRVSPGGGQP